MRRSSASKSSSSFNAASPACFMTHSALADRCDSARKSEGMIYQNDTKAPRGDAKAEEATEEEQLASLPQFLPPLGSSQPACRRASCQLAFLPSESEKGGGR